MIHTPSLAGMSEPTPPGSSEPPVPSAPSYEPPSAPASPPPSAPGGYGPPPVVGNVAPAGFANNDDKTWALVAHFGGAAGALLGAGGGGWVAPLIALLVQGPKSPAARAHAVEALNFQIGISIVSIVCWILSCLIIPIFIALAATVVGVVFGVLAGIKANEGQLYTYPMSFLKLVK
ncbi:hypothetical protein GCM10009661_41020 [Catellatospora chokoriensis]|uniref:DUF4870 domain-containing protein n=2 Tax=Catellatospora chokoriensis TaxID=310353 RepID=A0A8J3JVF2_9ACTN|nr:hypothetical protein Cch02nite_10220 [Catellatospora chokoriensis]